MKDVKVSVIMVTYNRANILLHAIKSVIEQTYKNFELIIIDAASEDNTIQILDNINKKDTRIKWTRVNIHNYMVALNRGIDFSTGDYISFIDSDDIILPNKLEYQVEFLNTHPKVDVVGCTTLFNKQYGIANTVSEMDHKKINEILKTTNMCETIHFQSTMIRRSVIDKIFKDKEFYLYPELTGGHEGEAFLYTLYFNKAKFANINSTIYLYRLGACDNSMTKTMEPKFFLEYIKDKPLAKRKKVILDLYNKYTKKEN